MKAGKPETISDSDLKLLWMMAKSVSKGTRYRIAPGELLGAGWQTFARIRSKWNPSLGQLQTFVWARVTGAMKDHLRVYGLWKRWHLNWLSLDALGPAEDDPDGIVSLIASQREPDPCDAVEAADEADLMLRCVSPIQRYLLWNSLGLGRPRAYAAKELGISPRWAQSLEEMAIVRLRKLRRDNLGAPPAKIV